MKNFRTLDLAVELNRACQRVKANRFIRDQLMRAVLSIPLNLAEGSSKPTSKDRRKFYYIALGSLRETQTLLKILGERELIQQADKVGAHLYKLCQAT